MKKYFLIISFLLAFISLTDSQWQRTIGGTNDDDARYVIQTPDGGYAITGFTTSFSAGYDDIYIVKLSSTGLLQWTKTIGWTGNDYALTILHTSDNGYAIAGYTVPYGSIYYVMLIVKLDTAGSIQWSRTINRAAYDYSCSIVQTADGGFAIAGVSATGGVFSGDIYIVKLNSEGTYQWSKTYGGSHDEVAYSIIQTSDGGLAFAGYSNSFGPYNLFNIIKTDSLGNIQWNRLIGESGTGSHVYSLIQLSDGSFVLAGEFTPTGTGNYDMYIVKLNSSGSLLWTRTVSGAGYDMANSIIQTSDGSFVLGGYTNSFGSGGYDMYIVKLNSSGALQWSKTVGGTGDEQALSIVKTTDGGFIAAGYTSSFGSGGKDIFVVKFDASGNTCGNTTTPSSSSGTSGTATNPAFTVITQNPTITSPTPVLGTGGILTTVCGIFPPLAPNLLLPPNGSYNQPTTLRFTWNRSQFASSYRLQISLDSAFTNLTVNDSTLSDTTIIVSNLILNRYYWWRVNAKNTVGTSPYSSVWKFGTFLVGLQQISSEIPKEFSLKDNYPNPFNPVTKIRFDIPMVDIVSLKIYDILGREVITLVNDQLQPGIYEAEWNAGNYPSGVYFYRMESGDYTETRKMVLLK